MTKYQNLYCKIYLNCDVSRDELIQSIATIVNGKINVSSILTPDCEIDVRKNEDFDENQCYEYPDGFLYYPYYLDIEPTEEIASIFYKQTITRLLEAFWAEKSQAVAACDFEEELPRKGGYKWKLLS